jgi:hypothetical protein
MEHILRNVLLTLLDQEFRINNTKKFPKIYYKILIKGAFYQFLTLLLRCLLSMLVFFSINTNTNKHYCYCYD